MLAGGITAAMLIAFFLPDMQMGLPTNCIGVIAIVGITAFHFENLKEIETAPDCDKKSSKKLALFCALKLYIDYVNLAFFITAMFIREQDKES